MCNLFKHYKAWDEYAALMQAEALEIGNDPWDMPQGLIHPSDVTPVITLTTTGSRVDPLRWGWPPHGGKGLVINVRSETRKDPPEARGLVLLTSLFEYGKGRAPKPQWEFTPAGNEPMAFPVIVRHDRYSLMTCEPGPDVAPIHDRQSVLITKSDWRRWLLDEAWPADIIHPSPAGTLRAEQTRGGSPKSATPDLFS